MRFLEYLWYGIRFSTSSYNAAEFLTLFQDPLGVLFSTVKDLLDPFWILQFQVTEVPIEPERCAANQVSVRSKLKIAIAPELLM